MIKVSFHENGKVSAVSAPDQESILAVFDRLEAYGLFTCKLSVAQISKHNAFSEKSSKRVLFPSLDLAPEPDTTFSNNNNVAQESKIDSIQPIERRRLPSKESSSFKINNSKEGFAQFKCPTCGQGSVMIAEEADALIMRCNNDFVYMVPKGKNIPTDSRHWLDSSTEYIHDQINKNLSATVEKRKDFKDFIKSTKGLAFKLHDYLLELSTSYIKDGNMVSRVKIAPGTNDMGVCPICGKTHSFYDWVLTSLDSDENECPVCQGDMDYEVGENETTKKVCSTTKQSTNDMTSDL